MRKKGRKLLGFRDILFIVFIVILSGHKRG